MATWSQCLNKIPLPSVDTHGSGQAHVWSWENGPPYRAVPFTLANDSFKGGCMLVKKPSERVGVLSNHAPNRNRLRWRMPLAWPPERLRTHRAMADRRFGSPRPFRPLAGVVVQQPDSTDQDRLKFFLVTELEIREKGSLT